jgi:hypothetical protein
MLCILLFLSGCCSETEVSEQLYSVFHILSTNVNGRIAHNVPAVYDVLAARISKCVAFAGPAKCAKATE